MRLALCMLLVGISACWAEQQLGRSCAVLDAAVAARCAGGDAMIGLQLRALPLLTQQLLPGRRHMGCPAIGFHQLPVCAAAVAVACCSYALHVGVLNIHVTSTACIVCICACAFGSNTVSVSWLAAGVLLYGASCAGLG
jgi:hypothetical protein